MHIYTDICHTMGSYNSQCMMYELLTAGMKVVSCKKLGKEAKTITSTANFRENTDFPSIGLTRNRGKIPEVRFQLSLMCLYYHPHLARSCLGFMF